MFVMECLACLISSSCKSGVVNVQSEDGSLDTSSTRAKMNKSITITKKSKKGAAALIQAQKHYKISNFFLLAPDKTRFASILYSVKNTPHEQGYHRMHVWTNDRSWK